MLIITGLLVFSSVLAQSEKSSLHEAVLDDDTVRVERLLRKGADINQTGSRKYGYGAALHLAIAEGYNDIVWLLIYRGADVNVRDQNDFTPLHYAAWNGNLEILRLLLDAGADINASNYEGDTPQTLAQNNDQTQVAEFIESKLQTPVLDFTGTYFAYATGDTERLFRSKGKRTNFIVKIVQAGNKITGSYGVPGEGHPSQIIWGEGRGGD